MRGRPPLLECGMERVRLAVLEDASAIASVHRESRAEYYGDPPEVNDGREAMWEHLLALKDGATYVVEDDEAIVAFLSVRHIQESDPTLEMVALYVQPGRFGRGTGTLLHEVFQSERGTQEAGLLEVWAGNQRAIDFYRRHGWVATSTTRPGPHDKPYITYALVMGLAEPSRTLARICRDAVRPLMPRSGWPFRGVTACAPRWRGSPRARRLPGRP